MTLWLIFALMTAAAIFAVVVPLVRRRANAQSGSDVAVYRDQLDEIERDVGVGLIGKVEAEAARVEVSRRLISAVDAAQATPAAASRPLGAVWPRRTTIFVALFLLPAGAASLYFRLGSPGLGPETPAAQANFSPDQRSSIDLLVTKVEAHLQRNPEDGRGWEVLAPVYMQLGRYTDSVNAWRNTLRLLGESADREANLGEALMAQANGIVTADAKNAFARAVTLDGTSVSARYYLGIAAEQDGRRDQAAKIFNDLISDAPPGAHWLDDVRTALARIEGKAPAPSPDAAQMAAAAQQPPEQQATMIRGMVEGLAARLKKDGSDLEGWVKLVRAYRVLGDPDKAQAAITDARQAMSSELDKKQRFEAALKELNAEQGATVAAPTSPKQIEGPSAAGGAPPQHDGEMRAMVDRLAERLEKSGSDPEGWVMLIRSYLTLGEKSKVAKTIIMARTALAGDAEKLHLFNEALQRFKIDETRG